MMLRIRELRESRGMQQKELAIDLCVSQPTVSDWESGRKVPSARSTQKIADYFGVSMDYLLGRDAEEKKPPAQSGELIGPAKQELLDMIDGLNEKEIAALSDVVRATIKMRDTK